MMGVEVLESNSDCRYKYFNKKIQSLMKKKYVIQELHMASTGHHTHDEMLLKGVNTEEVAARKN